MLLVMNLHHLVDIYCHLSAVLIHITAHLTITLSLSRGAYKNKFKLHIFATIHHLKWHRVRRSPYNDCHKDLVVMWVLRLSASLSNSNIAQVTMDNIPVATI